MLCDAVNTSQYIQQINKNNCLLVYAISLYPMGVVKSLNRV